MKEAIRDLKNRANQKGYVTFDEIISVSERDELTLKDIDSVTGLLIDEGFLLFEDEPEQVMGVFVDDGVYDKSHIDYNEIYNEVLSIAPQLSTYIDEVRKIPSPRKGEENELIVLAKEGNNYATTRIILMFLKIVIRMALYFHKQYGLPLEETIQEGNTGLIIAIEKYDIKPGNRFSTYMPLWIRQIILRQSTGICDKFYLPVHLRDDLLKLIKHLTPKNIELFQGNLSQAFNIPDVAKATELSESKIEKYLLWLEEPFCFEDYEGNELDFMLRPNFIEEEVFDLAHYNQPISDYLNTLKDRDRSIMEFRYGLNGSEPKTLEEIGNKLNMTRERVRQIEKKIVVKLKFELLGHNYSKKDTFGDDV